MITVTKPTPQQLAENAEKMKSAQAKLKEMVKKKLTKWTPSIS